MSLLDTISAKLGSLAGRGSARAVRDDMEGVYASVVGAARRPVFYEAAGTPDTAEGRFEILAIHILLTMRRMKQAGDSERRRIQALLDIFFQNLDDALREMGVGDLVVGKKIRRMAEAFYGRVAAYTPALDGREEAALAGAIARNVFTAAEPDEKAALLARYMVQADDALASTPIETIMAPGFEFPPFNGPDPESGDQTGKDQVGRAPASQG